MGRIKKSNRCDILKIAVEKVLWTWTLFTLIKQDHSNSSLYLNPVTPSRCRRIALYLNISANIWKLKIWTFEGKGHNGSASKEGRGMYKSRGSWSRAVLAILKTKEMLLSYLKLMYCRLHTSLTQFLFIYFIFFKIHCEGSLWRSFFNVLYSHTKFQKSGRPEFLRFWKLKIWTSEIKSRQLADMS